MQNREKRAKLKKIWSIELKRLNSSWLVLCVIVSFYAIFYAMQLMCERANEREFNNLIYVQCAMCNRLPSIFLGLDGAVAPPSKPESELQVLIRITSLTTISFGDKHSS